MKVQCDGRFGVMHRGSLVGPFRYKDAHHAQIAAEAAAYRRPNKLFKVVQEVSCHKVTEKDKRP